MLGRGSKIYIVVRSTLAIRLSDKETMIIPVGGSDSSHEASLVEYDDMTVGRQGRARIRGPNERT